MPTQASFTTAAEQLRRSTTVTEAIDAVLGELAEAQASITGVRPPSAELAETYQSWLSRHAEVKGKPPLYPYIGSGLGRGPLVELADGSVKWDLINGIGVHMFGHGDPDLVATALRAATSDVVMQGNLQFNADSIEFAELLVAEAGRASNLRHCFLTGSGAMANESALKICQQRAGGRAPRIIAFDDCFMGRSTTMAQIGDNPAGRAGLPLNVQVDYVPFYDDREGSRSIDAALERLQRHLRRYPGQHACFVMELVQGEGGFNQAPPEFFQALMETCRSHEVAVWVDEVQTFGRTQEMFHFQQLGLGRLIDIVTIGKMSQVCACLYTAECAPKPGLLSGTFIGSTVGLHVGRRLLERLRDGGYYGAAGRIAALHAAFREHARALTEKHPDWFEATAPAGAGHADRFYGGVGGMMRITPLGGEKPRILEALKVMFQQGLIAFYCGHDPYHIRFLPPVGVMQPEQFQDVFEILESSLEAVAAGH